MTALVWDKVGEKLFETGVDRGVLYLPDKAVAWNGLTAVEESEDQTSTSVYLDGVKYLQRITPGDYVGKLTAYTYPDEFELCTGAVESSVPGLNYHNQKPKMFGLSYRTRIGNDSESVDHGYRIHLLYNLMADPDTFSYGTIDSSVKPSSFSWSLSGVPLKLSGRRPTNHLSIDSTVIDSNSLGVIEEILYGTDSTEPSLPSITELLSHLGVLLIIDNHDGTWTIIDNDDSHITMTDSTTFEVDDIAATFDDDTYFLNTIDG